MTKDLVSQEEENVNDNGKNENDPKLDCSESEQPKVMENSSKQMVVYQKKETRWDVLADLDALEEGEIQDEAENMIDNGVSQNFPELQLVPMLQDPSICKDIVPYRKDLDREKMKEEGINMKSQPNQKNKVQKKKSSAPKGVETRSRKMDQKAKVKPNVGTPKKLGRKSLS